MRANSLVFSILLFLVVAATGLRAQWIHAGPPPGIGGGLLAVKGSLLFAGDEGTWDIFSGGSDGVGVFLSTDGGVGWTEINSGFPTLNSGYYQPVLTLAVVGDWVFAGTGGGLYRTSNNGRMWSRSGSVISVRALCLVDNGLFAATGYTIYRSTDEGQNWTRAATGIPSGANPDVLAGFGSSLYAGGAKGVFRTTDGGANWFAVNAGLPQDSTGAIKKVDAIAVVPDGSGAHLLAGVGAAIYHSTDAGGNWTVLASELKNPASPLLCTVRTFATVPDASGGNAFLVGTAAGAFRSTDGGASWHTINSGIMWDVWGSRDVLSFVSMSGGSGGSRIYAGSSGSVHLSTDGGAHWNSVGYSPTPIERLFKFNGILFGATFSGLFRSTDDGATWTDANDGLEYPGVGCFTTTGMDLFAGGWNGVFRSTDDGANWTPADSGLPVSFSTGSVSALLSSGADLFAAISGGEYSDGYIYRSSDNGASWRRSDTGLPHGSNTYTHPYALAESNGELFAGTSVGIYRSTDKGNSWHAVYEPQGGKYVSINLLTASGSRFLAAGSGLVHLSDDGGRTWTQPLLPGMRWTTSIDAIAVSGSSRFVGSLEGVFITTDSGNSWASSNSGLPQGDAGGVRSFFLERGMLYAGTAGAGVYRRPLSEMMVGSERIADGVPGRFSLEQNYPNPCRIGIPVSFVFEIPERGRVTLTMSDALGREVAILVDKVIESGRHSTSWSVPRILPGMYLCRLRLGSRESARKVLVLF